MNRNEVLQQFGFKNDPFRRVWMDTADSIRVGSAVKAICEDQGMMAVVGARGAGKSEAVRRAVPADVQIVEPLTQDVTRIKAGDVLVSMIYDLSNKTPARGLEARSRQLRLVLGEASRKAPVLLIIEECHFLHGMTVRALKRMREIRWMGKDRLFGVCLIGQADPFSARGMDEVRLRSETCWMRGLTADEANGYLERTVGQAFEPTAREALAQSPRAKNWLDLQEQALLSMESALARGAIGAKVTVSDVMAATGSGMLETCHALGLSLAAIGKKIGKSKSQISRVLSGERKDDDTKAAVQAIIDAEMQAMGIATPQSSIASSPPSPFMERGQGGEVRRVA